MIEPAPLSVLDDPLFADFMEEAVQLLDRFHDRLLSLETQSRGEQDRDCLDELFRAIHSLKGLASVFELSELREQSHDIETRLADIRDGHSPLDAEVLEELFQAEERLLCQIESLRASTAEAKSNVRQVVDTPGESASESGSRGGRHAGHDSIRVSAEALDRLARLAEELSQARTLFSQCHGILIAGPDDAAVNADPLAQLQSGLAWLEGIGDRLSSIISETRTTTFDRLAKRLHRVVRETARHCGKQVRLHVTGGATRLDRHLVERLAQPLTQIARNACDHGIESPDERRRVGKPVVGAIRVAAVADATGVVLSIADDGRGLDRPAIARRARERGIPLPGPIESLSDIELARLLGEPGLSTAAEVTITSGRGIGMDIVRTTVEDLGGQLAVESRPGAGVTFRLAFPR